jgi:hypothetical protein
VLGLETICSRGEHGVKVLLRRQIFLIMRFVGDDISREYLLKEKFIVFLERDILVFLGYQLCQVSIGIQGILKVILKFDD